MASSGRAQCGACGWRLSARVGQALALARAVVAYAPMVAYALMEAVLPC
jgi:hypothetical protein